MFSSPCHAGSSRWASLTDPLTTRAAPAGRAGRPFRPEKGTAGAGKGDTANSGRLAFCLEMDNVTGRPTAVRPQNNPGRAVFLTTGRHVLPSLPCCDRPGPPRLQVPQRRPAAAAPPAALRHGLRPSRQPQVLRRPLRRLAAAVLLHPRFDQPQRPPARLSAGQGPSVLRRPARLRWLV